MATKIVTKNSSTSGSAPLASDLVQGELAVNVTDKRLYTENASGTIVEVGTNPSTLTVTGEITANGGIALGDNDKATFGAGDDLQIYHDGSNSVIADTGTGSLNIKGAVNLYYNDSLRLQTGATGNYLAGTTVLDALNVALPIEANGIALGDNDKATFGLSDDLQIFHDGTDSFISDQGTGNLKLLANDFRLANAANNQLMVAANQDGAVTAYYSGSPKLATTSTGIDVTGTATMDGLVVEGNGALFTLDNGSNAATLSNTNGNVVLDYDAAEAGRSFTVQQNGRKSLRVNNSGDVSFYEDTGTTPKFFWDASAESLGIGKNSLSYTATDRSNVEIKGASSALLALQSGNENSYLFKNGTTLNINNQSSGPITFDTAAAERMRINASGNVGIGTSVLTSNAIVRELAIKATATDGVARYTLTTTDNGLGAAISLSSYLDANALSFGLQTSYDEDGTAPPTERMRIDSSGNVGIGTSSPASVSGGTSTHGTLTVGSTDGSMVVGDVAGALSFSTFDASYTGTYADGITSEIASVSESSVGGAYGLAFYTATTTGSNRAERMRIGASGNVGIGCVPQSNLDIDVGLDTSLGLRSQTGVIVAQYTGAPAVGNRAQIGLGYGNTYTNVSIGAVRTSATAYGTDDFIIATKSGTADTAPTERMRIDSSGNLLVGTTATGFVNDNGWSKEGGSVVQRHNSSQTSGTAYTWFTYNASAIGSISQSGTTAVLYNTSSDARLKDNITDANDAGDKIDAIQVRQYDWKADGSHQDYGMIAQELQLVAPEAVSGDADSEEMMGVDYSKLVPMLIKEIQSLRNRVAQLEE